MNIILDCDAIRKYLPHRYPFLLLDRVTQLVPGVEATGIKNVTVNEPFFQGHFPERSIMPGVMIIEALAQLTAVVYCSRILASKGIQDIAGPELLNIDPEEIASHVGYLADVNVKFKRIVVPGDQLTLRAIIGKSLGLLSQVQVSAYVGNIPAAEGKLTVSERR